MSDLLTAARQALDVMEITLVNLHGHWRGEAEKIIIALRQAIEQAGKQEPVAWQCAECGGYHLLCPHGRQDIPLYTSPPQPKPEQEPVAWVGQNGVGYKYLRWKKPGNVHTPPVPLYTAPPQRKPLTDEAIRDLWSWSMTAEAERAANTQQHAFARAIERAHGIGEQHE